MQESLTVAILRCALPTNPHQTPPRRAGVRGSRAAAVAYWDADGLGPPFRVAAEAGADIIVAQGPEAGGHGGVVRGKLLSASRSRPGKDATWRPFLSTV